MDHQATDASTSSPNLLRIPYAAAPQSCAACCSPRRTTTAQFWPRVSVGKGFLSFSSPREGNGSEELMTQINKPFPLVGGTNPKNTTYKSCRSGRRLLVAAMGIPACSYRRADMMTMESCQHTRTYIQQPARGPPPNLAAAQKPESTSRSMPFSRERAKLTHLPAAPVLVPFLFCLSRHCHCRCNRDTGSTMPRKEGGPLKRDDGRTKATHSLPPLGQISLPISWATASSGAISTCLNSPAIHRTGRLGKRSEQSRHIRRQMLHGISCGQWATGWGILSSHGDGRHITGEEGGKRPNAEIRQ